MSKKRGSGPIVIYDRQYSPLLFEHQGQTFLPAESVYAVFEVRQEFSRENLLYASAKAASVRSLHRTSAEIPHAGGRYAAKDPPHIIAGVLALATTWSPPFGSPFLQALNDVDVDGRLDLGCCLSAGAFEVSYAGAGPSAQTSDPAKALLSFFLSLNRQLQELGTVAAIDLTQWAQRI